MKRLKKYPFLLIMLGGLVLGGSFRLFRIGTQLFWDDEWHTVYRAIFHPLKYILTHLHWDYNSIPLTIYNRIMLESVGLNEAIVRFPLLLSGILILLLFPWMVKKLFDQQVASIFLFLLAISPLLIYFSRTLLSFNGVILLSFISVWSFYQWLREGKKIYVAIYLVGAVLAPYFHISAIAFVSGPILYVLILWPFEKRLALEHHYPHFPRFPQIALVILVFLAGTSIWLLPLMGTFGPIFQHSRQGFINLGTLGGTAFLFCGSRTYYLCGLLIALFIYGLYLLSSTHRVLLGYLISVCVVQFAFIVIPRPFLVQISMIFTRYFSPVLPIWLLVVSFAISDLCVRLRRVLGTRTKLAKAGPVLGLAGLFAVIVLQGPLPRVYSYPNDFTNHKDFQYNYLHLDDLPDSVKGGDGVCPAFYRALKEGDEKTAMIEFPAVVSWTWNIFHVYQSVHKKRVAVGYDGNAYGLFLGYEAFQNKNVRFHNFVDISDPRLLRGRGFAFLVIHKDIWRESAVSSFLTPEIRRQMVHRVANLDASLRSAMQRYVSETIRRGEVAFGRPYYEDEWIVVYRIPSD